MVIYLFTLPPISPPPQCRGRARQRGAEYLLMLEAGNLVQERRMEGLRR